MTSRIARPVLLAVLALAACGGGTKHATTPPPAPDAGVTAGPTGAPAVKPVNGTFVADTSYRVELAPLPACTAGAACEAKVVVRALADYHVNVEFPSRFVAAAASHPVEGTGTFTIPEPTTGVMTLQFTPAGAGTAHLEGTLKFAVCTELVCEPRSVAIAFDVPVS